MDRSRARLFPACLGMTLCLVLAMLPRAHAEDAAPPPPQAGSATAPQAQPPVTLREAVAKGWVTARGFDASSYRAVHVEVANRTAEPLRVDLCGSYLEPRRRGSCQRLGLGPVITPRGKKGPARRTRPGPRAPDVPPGTVVIELPAGAIEVVHVQTCCLDAGLPAPSRHQFEASREALPAVRENALRWWADHPATPQGLVNRAIWQSRPMHEVLPNAWEGGQSLPPIGGDGLAAHAGTVYALRRGDLVSRDEDGVERFLGTQMDGVHPTDSAIYGISWGRPPPLGESGRAPRELWRLVPTGREPWTYVATLDPGLRVLDIQVGPDGTIVALTGEGLFRVDPGAHRLRRLLATKEPEHLSIAFERSGRMRVTKRRPSEGGYYQGGDLKGAKMPVCELWAIDPSTGTCELVREFWNVAQILTGPAGTYALSPGGRLRRLQGRSLRNAPGRAAYDHIVRVGRRHVWLETKQGRLVAVDKIGRRAFDAGPARPGDTQWDMDAHSDRLVVRDGRKLFSVDPDTGRQSPVR